MLAPLDVPAFVASAVLLASVCHWRGGERGGAAHPLRRANKPFRPMNALPRACLGCHYVQWRCRRFLERARLVWPIFPPALVPVPVCEASSLLAAAAGDSAADAATTAPLDDASAVDATSTFPPPVIPDECAARLHLLICAELWAGVVFDIVHVTLIALCAWRLPACLHELLPAPEGVSPVPSLARRVITALRGRPMARPRVPSSVPARDVTAAGNTGPASQRRDLGAVLRRRRSGHPVL